mmetsp:Transcript_130699/g.279489  ORF Transcript_130699/g.279489 Transcript_130699/m.279489 type:complete len:529 (-) Transcript_130699:33-1619(-)
MPRKLARPSTPPRARTHLMLWNQNPCVESRACKEINVPRAMRRKLVTDPEALALREATPSRKLRPSSTEGHLRCIHASSPSDLTIRTRPLSAGRGGGLSLGVDCRRKRPQSAGALIPSGNWPLRDQQLLLKEAQLAELSETLRTFKAAPMPKIVASSDIEHCEAQFSLTAITGSRLATLIGAGCIGLVRSSYFEDCLFSAHPFQARQQISLTGIWDPQQALDLWKRYGKCFLCIVSYPWLSKEHPDPNLFHLRKLVRIFNEYKRLWGMTEVAVILDYCSLWQRGASTQDLRTKEQKELFTQGIREINTAFGHKAVTTFTLREVPADEPRQYDDRGWTLLESIFIDSKAGDWNRWVFDSLDPKSDEWADAHNFFLSAIPRRLRPPLTPQAFAAELEARRLRAASRSDGLAAPLFRDEEDQTLVPMIYSEIFAEMSQARRLCYDSAKWTDTHLDSLIEVLPSCDHLEDVQLLDNNIGGEGARKLATIIPQLRKLNHLRLNGNPLCRDDRATGELRSAWNRVAKQPRNLEI